MCVEIFISGLNRKGKNRIKLVTNISLKKKRYSREKNTYRGTIVTMVRERKPLWVNETVNTEVQGSTVYLTAAQSLEADNSQIHRPRCLGKSIR